MATVNVNFRIDEDLKREADKLFSDLGLNMSVAVTMFLKAAVNTEGIPFDIKRIPSNEMLLVLAEYDDMMKNPENYRSYSSFDEFFFEAMKI
ncbi:MAG: type II toxin-antitoxin system RelB/DinJ family antitoxin [Saccharofermentans sp.]|nr:type II toxin-antitoxin system RelB/DinJ family antitoxin [Saccharofermentans sp.]